MDYLWIFVGLIASAAMALVSLVISITFLVISFKENRWYE